MTRHVWAQGCTLSLGLLLNACAATNAPLPARPDSQPTPAPQLTLDQQLERGARALDAGRYAEAETAFTAASKGTEQRFEADLGLRKVYVATGRYAAAAQESPRAGTDSLLDQQTLQLRAKALRALGQLDAAAALLRTSPTAAARVELGTILIARGETEESKRVLLSVIDDSAGNVGASDGIGMSLVGRAAFLLRSPERANDEFNSAQQLPGLLPDETFLWRAELYLEHHDSDRAEEVLTELLERNPHHPEALVGLARVKLDQALDFDEAKRLVHEALRTNPNLADGHAVLAAVALYDMQLDAAQAHVQDGLRTNPRDLTLLSLLGASKFLADDTQGFEQVRQQVLTHNPRFARFFSVVGTFAEWEHRYDDIVGLMNQALAIDPYDAKILAQLGLNLIRNGEDSAGLLELRSAYASDPYDVRVYNTLELYEKTIPQKYVSRPGERFNFRYAKIEEPILEHVVPPMLNTAWDKMVKSYAFEPTTPIGIEIYAERESFAIRTSGLPQTAIQGVCFGKTLASMSPYFEKFNLGMTLWHELAHVFHIQLSKNHVPRWFTEGLAEYETLTERTEWRREQDLELHVALTEGRLPKVSAMNEAFTHAEDIQDVAVAYYASTQIVHMLAESYGYTKLREMLVLWGRGLDTASVVQTALGIGLAQLDTQFEGFLAQRLARYAGQFTPSQRVGNPERIRKAVTENPTDTTAASRLALLLMESRKYDQAKVVVQQVLKLDPKHPYGLWLSARLELGEGNTKASLDAVDKLLASGHDGYETQLLRGKALELAQDDQQMQVALRKAHEYDPFQAEPLYALLAHARDANDKALELETLKKLVTLEEHNGAIFRELAELLLEGDSKNHAQAVEVGQSAVFAEMYNPSSHVSLAQAYERVGDIPLAVSSFDAALLAPGSDGELIDAHRKYAEFCRRHGKLTQAKRLEAQASRLQASADGSEG